MQLTLSLTWTNLTNFCEHRFNSCQTCKRNVDPAISSRRPATAGDFRDSDALWRRPVSRSPNFIGGHRNEKQALVARRPLVTGDTNSQSFLL